MKKVVVIFMALSLSIFLFSCGQGSKYDFVYELTDDSYSKFMDLKVEMIEGKGYVKYELFEEGYIDTLIVTVEIRNSSSQTTEIEVKLKNEGESYEINDDGETMGYGNFIARCSGTLYTNQFENVYGFKLNRAKSDIGSLNDALSIYNDQTEYTTTFTLETAGIIFETSIGFRSDPFYYYVLTPFDRTVYTYEESNSRYKKRYQDQYEQATTYLSESEMAEETGIGEDNIFLFPKGISVYQELEDKFYIFGTIEDLKNGLFTDDTFEDISEDAQFKMNIKIISEERMYLNFYILDDDIEYKFKFVYNFGTFDTIDYLFETEY